MNRKYGLFDEILLAIWKNSAFDRVNKIEICLTESKWNGVLIMYVYTLFIYCYRVSWFGSNDK